MTMKDVNNQYCETVKARYMQNAACGLRAVEYIKNSTAVYKGKPVPCLYMPKIFTADAYDSLKTAAETMHQILEKVIAKYHLDPGYRKLFPFASRLRDMILSDAGYSCLLPIARIDIFLNEEDLSFKFCEFNADGSSAMNEDRELNNAIKDCDAMNVMGSDYEFVTCEFFDSWASSFINVYRSYASQVENPNVAIVDFIDGGVPNEFTQFRKAFERAGLRTQIVDVRRLLYDRGKLMTREGGQIHAVYRRAVTRDIMDNFDSVQPFVKAVTEGAVCSVGHFRTQVIHNKTIFRILHMDETLSFLTEDERQYVKRHVPMTFILEEGKFDLDQIIKNKNQWLVKPDDLYASRGVWAGVDTCQDVWEKAVRDCLGKGYILQEYVTPYKSPNLDFNENPSPGFEYYNNITGMFMYNGKLQGFYSRGGPNGVISGLTGGLTIASVIAHERTKSS